MSELTSFGIMRYLPKRINDETDFEMPMESMNELINYSNYLVSVFEDLCWDGNGNVDYSLDDEPKSKREDYTLTLTMLEGYMDDFLSGLGKQMNNEQKAFVRPYLRAFHHKTSNFGASVSPGMGLAAWLACSEVGASSKFMVTYLHDSVPTSEFELPYDLGDFDRCKKALIAIPELKDKLDKMKLVSLGWCEIIENWDYISSVDLETANDSDLNKERYREVSNFLQNKSLNH